MSSLKANAKAVKAQQEAEKDKKDLQDIARSNSSMQAEIDFISTIMEKPVIGTTFAKFVGFYCPVHEKTMKTVQLDDAEKDDALTAALEADRNGPNYGHRKKRDWMKHYMDEDVKYRAVKGK